MNGGHSSFYSFDPIALSVVAGGASTLDQPKLHIHNLEEADSFLKSYGYDVAKEADQTRLLYFHRRALVLMSEKLKIDLTQIPDSVRQPEQLKDVRNLLIWASQTENKNIQRWACAVLRCIHVFVHAETDLFSFYSEEIQRQILSPFERSIMQEDKLYLRSFQKEGHPQVELLHFQAKPFKTSSSTVIKLLAKPDALAMKVFDKIGVRFVTKTIFDSFQVIRFLVEENLMSFPHIMPDQSSNNMFPVDEFLQVCKKLEAKHGPLHRMEAEKIDRLLKQKLKSSSSAFLSLFRKDNPYSAIDFRYIKFISRKLIEIHPQQGKSFSFFYPYEVQIMDQEAYQKMQSGESDHSAYKNRQIEAARKRILPE